MAMIPDLAYNHQLFDALLYYYDDNDEPVQKVDVLNIGKHHGHNWLFDYNTTNRVTVKIKGHDERSRSRIVSVMILALLIRDVQELWCVSFSQLFI